MLSILKTLCMQQKAQDNISRIRRGTLRAHRSFNCNVRQAAITFESKELS
jgi:hypothetical protein